MPPASAVFVQDNLLPLSFVSLGRFVLNTQEPNHAFWDPKEQAEEALKPQSNVRDILRQSQGRSFYTKLSGLFSADRDRQAVSDVLWSTRQTKTIQQLNSDKYFKKACGEEDTRKWIEGVLENGRDVYMIVGYATVLNATVSDRVMEIKRFQAECQIPAKEVAAGMSSIPLLTATIKNPDLGGRKTDNIEHQRTFRADGQQVYAVQYRKLVFRFFSSKNLDQGFLEDESRWKLYWTLMGDDEEEDDVVEATIDGDFASEKEEFEIWQPEYSDIPYFIRKTEPESSDVVIEKS